MEESTEQIILNYLEGIATSSERDKLSFWLKESEENRQIFLTYYDSWSLSQQVKFNPFMALKKMNILMENSHIIKNIRHRGHEKKIYIYASIAATLFLIVTGAWFSINNSAEKNSIRNLAIEDFNGKQNCKNIELVLSGNNRIILNDRKINVTYGNNGNIRINDNDNKTIHSGSMYNQLIVPNGKKGILTLVDGTKIWIKSGTKLMYPVKMNRKIREIYVDGEVYLEVSHKMKKPFIVRTNDLNVKVVGTKFDVSAYSKEWPSRVVLVSGRVNVSLKDENDKSTKKLMPNQMYSLNVKKRGSIRNVDASKYIAWIEDIYTCNDENMDQLLNKLIQTYGVKIRYGKDIASLHCTGKFDLQQPLSELLREISEIIPFKYQKKNDGTYVVQK